MIILSFIPVDDHFFRLFQLMIILSSIPVDDQFFCIFQLIISLLGVAAVIADEKAQYPIGPQPHNFIGAGGYDPFGEEEAPLHAYHGPQYDQGPIQAVGGSYGGQVLSYGGGGSYGGGYSGGHGGGYGSYATLGQPQVVYVKHSRRPSGKGKGGGGKGGGFGGKGGGKGKGGDYYDYGGDYGYGGDYDYEYYDDKGGKGGGGKGGGGKGGKGGGGFYSNIGKGWKSVQNFCKYLFLNINKRSTRIGMIQLYF